MGLIIVAVIIVAIIIIIKVTKSKRRDKEYSELRDTIHNSGIIKELKRQLEIIKMDKQYDCLTQQTDYYDECDRSVVIFDSQIHFKLYRDGEWRMIGGLDFVNDLGYKPLLDNNLAKGAKHITREDIYDAFAYEVYLTVQELFNDDEIHFDLPKYYSGFEYQKQPDGTNKQIKVGDEHASIFYKVPKTIGAKQI